MTKTSWLVFPKFTQCIFLPQAECIAALEEQIVIEFQASLQYLLMAAHFSQVLYTPTWKILDCRLQGHGEPSEGSLSLLGPR